MNFPQELMKIKSKGGNMGGFVPLLYSLMTDLRIGQSNIKTVVEIGIRGGISTNSFLYGMRDRIRVNPSMKLYSIDISNCSNVVKDESLKKYWEFIQADSREFVWDKGEIDVLMIDGGHSYETCKSDYKKFEPYVKEGGIILMHDVTWAKKACGKVFFEEVKYPKSVLPLSKSGMGIIWKKNPPYYDDNLINFESEG